MNCAYHIHNAAVVKLQRLRTAALPGLRSPHQGISVLPGLYRPWASTCSDSRTSRTMLLSLRNEPRPLVAILFCHLSARAWCGV